MRRLAAPLALLLLLCAACCFGAHSAEPDVDPAAIARLRAQLDCTAQAFYCGALDRFEAAGEPTLEMQPYALVGRAYDTWNQREQIDWFVARPGGGMAVGEVTPDDEQERQQLEAALAILSSGGSLPSTDPVAAYVQTLATGGDDPHATLIRGRSRHYPLLSDQRDVYIRRSGDEIIALDVGADGGVIAVFQRR
jgi:hypothetical protein